MDKAEKVRPVLRIPHETPSNPLCHRGVRASRLRGTGGAFSAARDWHAPALLPQAQREMQSIPEARSMSARASGSSSTLEAQSWPPAGSAPFDGGAAMARRSPFAETLPPMMSAELRATSAALAEDSGSFRSASSASFGPASPSADAARPAAQQPTLASPTASGQHTGQPLQAHAISLTLRGSNGASSSLGSGSVTRPRLGSLAEGPEEEQQGAMSPFAAVATEEPFGPPARGDLAGSSSRCVQQGFVLPGQVPETAFQAAAAPGAALQAAGVDVAEQKQNGHAHAAGKGMTGAGTSGGGGACESQRVSASDGRYRTAVTGIVRAPDVTAGVDAVLAGKSHATDAGALKELLELDAPKPE